MLAPVFRRTRFFPLSAVALLVAAACGGTYSGGPSIVTTSLAPAIPGVAYDASLSARGGNPPYVWTLTAADSDLAWLLLDSGSGAVTGVPQGGSGEVAQFEVRVTDASGRASSKRLGIMVSPCDSDAGIIGCGVPVQGACQTGVQLCVSGRLTDCTRLTPSDETQHCGPDCAECGTGGDACVNGSCRCGSLPGCSGTAPDCCSSGCVNMQTDVANCGGCGESCTAAPGAHVVPECKDGQCDLSTCVSGYARCAPVATHPACDVVLSTDREHCGNCDNACPDSPTQPHVVPGSGPVQCASGFCQLQCQSGFGDCDHALGDGCEADLTVGQTQPDTTVANCGTCGHTCDRPSTFRHATPGCASSACVPIPDSGWANCDNDYSNGAETDVTSSIDHCGSCNPCGTPFKVSAVACLSAECTVTQCAAGTADCNHTFGDGCEVDLNTDNDNCGACGHGCASNQTCVNGSCQLCPSCFGKVCCPPLSCDAEAGKCD